MAEAAFAVDSEHQAPVPGGPSLLFDRFEVDPGKPIPQLDTPSARAYAVEDRRDPSRNLYALICAPGVPPRTSHMAMLKGLGTTGVLELVEWGPLDWPLLGQRCMAVVYDRPLGGTLAEAFASGGRVSDYDLPRRVVEPLVRSLKELSAAGITHRAIRPNNLFYRDEGRHTPLFGDCVSAPPGFDQPLAYEPIERALASPSGRGSGDLADDIYALAVTLVVLVVGRNPVAHMSDDEILAAKVERGSYTALAERERVPMALIEPLRGMLNDDPAERWGLEQIELWLSGRRVAPARNRAIKHASMPFHFAGYDHVTTTTLARAMAQNVREAAAVAREGHLEPWLIRHLNAPELADTVNEIVEGTRAYEGDLRGTEDVMVARLAIVLDPAGPIRYKGFSFVIEGFGPALAVAWLRDGNTQTPTEAIALGLPGMWLGSQTASKPGFGAHDRLFAQLRAYLQASGPGYGLERCLYESNPALPCQSPLLSNSYVTEIRELMPVLDEAAGHASGSRPIDRHLAAFIAARFNQDIEPHLAAIADTREDKAIIGMLSLLALLQWRLKVPPLFGLSSWIGGMLGPAINTFHNRETRREIEREIPRLVRQGSLPDLYDLIDNSERRRRDRDGYASAVAEFAAAEAEIQQIEGSDVARSAESIRKGRRSAAMAAVVIGLVTVCVSLLLAMF